MGSDPVSATLGRGTSKVSSRKTEQQGCASFLASLVRMAALIWAELLQASVHYYMLTSKSFVNKKFDKTINL
jgi:hypothetical protein